jgi:hypothetical protein
MNGTHIEINGLCLPCIVGKLLRKHVGYFTVLILHSLYLLCHFTGCINCKYTTVTISVLGGSDRGLFCGICKVSLYDKKASLRLGLNSVPLEL